MVKEELLWALWQHLLFDVKDLKTIKGESLCIKKTGTLNAHAGPDFSLAHIAIDSIDWNGDVEMHARSSDWYKHAHQNDPSYESVILHVVYEFDKDILRADGTIVPVLELKHRIDPSHLRNYRSLMHSKSVIPCGALFHQVKRIGIEQMKQRVLVERLSRKTEELYHQLLLQSDWKIVAGRLIFKSFGTGLNDFLFERIASNLDFNRLARLSHSKLAVEAMLFGLSGMLELPFKDPYALELKKEFKHIKRTYGIKPVVHYSEWKFLRTRPINFPTVRLAQLAALFSEPDWFQRFIQLSPLKQAHPFFNIELSPYWHSHYRFDVLSVHSTKRPGTDFIDSFLINALVPFYALEGRFYNDADKWDLVFSWLELIQAEDNIITRNWQKINLKLKTAYDSQSAIELYKMYCTHKKCLSCSIGHSVLRNEYIPDLCS